MTKVIYPQEDGDEIVVNLREPILAAVLAWLFPGAGHFYQRRFPKAFLFMVCILSTYCAGMALGEGRVVYQSFKPGDFRWQFIGQMGIGIPAFPAIAQSMKVGDGGDPYWVLCERYPDKFSSKNPHTGPPKNFTKIPEGTQLPPKTKTLKDGFMAPPAGPMYTNENDVLGQWHTELKHYFEIGTLFTIVAGLLNLLAVYDAFSGPAIMTPDEKEEAESKRKSKRKKEA